MKLMDALNRIERSGQENSASTLKLKEAVALVAFEIVQRAAPSGLDLILGSHGFWIEVRDGGNLELRTNDGWNGYRVLATYFRPNGPELQGPHDANDITREDALAFAEAVSDGLIDKFADSIHGEAAQAEQAIQAVR